MSSSSLYGFTGNVVVSSNNVTTLYNATGGNVVTANVPDRDFTTLYTHQSDISPTKSYGNSNVEAFLNAGTDGANTVQNIIMTGNLTVGGDSSLGPVGNITITGGFSGALLATDGSGNLAWVDPTPGIDAVPYIHFDVVSTSNNQTFSNVGIQAYGNANNFSVFKNGVNIEPFYYEKTTDDTVQVNILLNTGDTIDILPSAGAGGSGGLPAGTTHDVQYNGGFSFAGSNTFTFTPSSNTLSVTNLVVPGHSNLGSVSNITISGGSANYFLRTDGAGNLTWVPQADANGHPAGSSGEIQFNNGANAFGSSPNLTFNTSSSTLTTINIAGNGSQLTSLTGANVTGTVANANFATYSNYASFSNIANISNVSYSISGSNVVGAVGSATTAGTVTSNSQPAITSVGTLTGITVTGVANLVGTSNVSLGSVSNLHISGGSANTYLKTDGTGNLSWVAVSGGSNATPGGSNTYVQFNDAGTFGGEATFYYNKTSQFLRAINAEFDTLQGLISAEEWAIFPGSTVTGTYTYDTSLSSVVLCTINTTGNFIINLTNLSMNTSGVRSFAFINKNAAGLGYHCTGVSIGGSAQTVNWAGGSAPTTGNTTDIYNITVIKTSGSPTYSVFVSVGGY